MDIAVKNLLFDAADHVEMFDVDLDRNLTKEEVDAKIAQLCYEYTGLTKNSTEKQIKRAFESEKGREFFAVIEEILEKKIATGLKENEFFNTYVEEVNIADGDKNEFWAQDDIILNIEKVAGSHHDLVIQKLNEGESFSIPTAMYGCKVGDPIRLFVLGRKSWSDFVDAVPKAYVHMIQNMLYTEFMNAANKLPVPAPFTGTGALNTTNKDDFDEIIENVEMSNDNAPVVIMGTKTALKKLNGLTDVDWRSNSQKEAVASTGILGSYESTTLLEIPQRFADNDVTKKLIDNTKLFIMPVVSDDKFVKYINGGETSLEVTEVGATLNDQQSYEVQRRIGVGTILTRNFGVWTLE